MDPYNESMMTDVLRVVAAVCLVADGYVYTCTYTHTIIHTMYAYLFYYYLVYIPIRFTDMTESLKL